MYGRWLRNSFIYLLILVAIVAIVFTVFASSSSGTVDESLDKFIGHVKAGEITKVDVSSDTLTYKLKGEDTTYTAKMETGDTVRQILSMRELSPATPTTRTSTSRAPAPGRPSSACS